MRSLRLAQPVRPRAGETGCRDDDHGAVAVQHRELAPVGHRRLVDVTRKNHLRASLGERREHVTAPCQRSLSRTPGRVRQLMVEADDPQRAGIRLREVACRPFERGSRQSAGLVAPGSHGVQTDDVPALRCVHGFRRLPDTLELTPRVREARRWQKRDVVVSGNREYGRAEAAKEGGSTIVLLGPAAVREVSRRDDEFGLQPRHERPQRRDGRLLTRTDMEVRDVDQARGHSRGRLYTRLVTDESTELFDDLYLGLRAGGAMRKQRRGEPLTMEEAAALNRWQRLSSWRKTIAVGAFAVGTFGLGFTLGGLVFGRGRKAKA